MMGIDVVKTVQRFTMIGLVVMLALAGTVTGTVAGERDRDSVSAERTSRTTTQSRTPSTRAPSTQTTTTRNTTTRSPITRSPSTPSQPAPTTPTQPAPITPSQPAPSQSGCLDVEEKAMLSLINNYRAQNGLGPVTLSPTLTNAAAHHSVDMANKNYFSHDLAGGIGWSKNISNFGYFGGTRAENIAAGYADAQRTFEQWVNSPGHRANMLSPNLNAIGIGRAYNSNSQYGWYWTTTFGGTVDSAASC